MDRPPYTAKELSAKWRVSVNMIYSLTQRSDDENRLPAKKIGGRVLIPAAGADAYWANHDILPPPYTPSVRLVKSTPHKSPRHPWHEGWDVRTAI